jgi:hypothetical protein
MQHHKLAPAELLKAIVIGIATALLLLAVMVPALRLGISPLPKPLGLASAETVLGRSLPLPVGLLFHVAYVISTPRRGGLLSTTLRAFRPCCEQGEKT